MPNENSRGSARCATLLSLCVGFATACAARTEAASTVLPYGSFGPQAMSYEVLGFEWWQWQPHGDSRPREYDVHVVVYCNSSTDEIARRYPVDRKAERDYRYITYERALIFLDENIQQDVDPALTDELRGTRKELVERLPSCRK
jgi:hypothetical protein